MFLLPAFATCWKKRGKKKRASKSSRIHIRRMKQEGRKTAGVTTPART
jgi:hypothetical protein